MRLIMRRVQSDSFICTFFGGHNLQLERAARLNSAIAKRIAMVRKSFTAKQKILKY